MGWYETMVARAAEVVTDEEILGVGVFEPPGAVKAGIATLHATDTMGVTEHRIYDGVPQHCLIAVTATKLHLIGVTAISDKNLATVVVQDPQPFAVIDRDHLEVTFHLRKLFPSTLLLDDLEHDRHYHLVGAAQKHLNGTARHVFDALEGQAGDATPADDPT
jgi:hypothetical protein